MAGHHRSPLPRQLGRVRPAPRVRGFGDELRRIDWKVFARNDRLVIKEFVEETTLDCHILVDKSESMAFGSLEPWTKFDYARWCAAALAHLVARPSVTPPAWCCSTDEMREKVPPGNGEMQKHRASSRPSSRRPSAEGETGVGNILALPGSARDCRRRGIVAVFSDFFEDLETRCSTACGGWCTAATSRSCSRSSTRSS